MLVTEVMWWCRYSEQPRKNLFLRSKSRTSICSSHLSSLDSSPVSDTRWNLGQGLTPWYHDHDPWSGVGGARWGLAHRPFVTGEAEGTAFSEAGGLSELFVFMLSAVRLIAYISSYISSDFSFIYSVAWSLVALELLLWSFVIDVTLEVLGGVESEKLSLQD